MAMIKAKITLSIHRPPKKPQGKQVWTYESWESRIFDVVARNPKVLELEVNKLIETLINVHWGHRAGLYE